MSHFQDVLTMKGWKTPADALEEMWRLRIIPRDKKPPVVPTGKGVPSAVTVFVGGKEWPLYRPHARTLCDAGEATWAPPSPEPEPTPPAATAPKVPLASKGAPKDK